MTTPRLSPRLVQIIEALPLEPQLRVLEIGCGPGAAARDRRPADHRPHPRHRQVHHGDRPAHVSLQRVHQLRSLERPASGHRGLRPGRRRGAVRPRLRSPRRCPRRPTSPIRTGSPPAHRRSHSPARATLHRRWPPLARAAHPQTHLSLRRPCDGLPRSVTAASCRRNLDRTGRGVIGRGRCWCLPEDLSGEDPGTGASYGSPRGAASTWRRCLPTPNCVSAGAVRWAGRTCRRAPAPPSRRPPGPPGNGPVDREPATPPPAAP